MKQPKDHEILIEKAAEAEALLVSILANSGISDAIFGFHAQQAVEKLMKEALAHAKALFPKTHDLSFLLDLLTQAKFAFPASETELQWLTPYATTLRCDEPSEETLDRNQSLTLVRSIRAWAEKLVSGK